MASTWQSSNLIFFRSLNLQCKGHEIYISIYEPTHTINSFEWRLSSFLPAELWKRALKSGAAFMNVTNYNFSISLSAVQISLFPRSKSV